MEFNEMRKLADETFKALLDEARQNGEDKAVACKLIFKTWAETTLLLKDAENKDEEVLVKAFAGKSAEEIFALKWNGILPQNVSCRGGGATVNILTRDWSAKELAAIQDNAAEED